MLRKLLPFCVCFFVTLHTFGQSANFRAQARYYSAKTAFDDGKYNDAARMAMESRDLLSNKSNGRLQHILVLSLYRAGRFKEAQAETARFFALHEGKEPREGFNEDVDKLTNNEVREITIILDDIDTKVRQDVEGAKIRAEQAKREAERRRAWEQGLLEWKYQRRVDLVNKLSTLINRSYSASYTTWNDQKATDSVSLSFSHYNGSYVIRHYSEGYLSRYGFSDRDTITITIPSLAGAKVEIRPRSADPRKGSLSYDNLVISVPSNIVRIRTKREDINDGRARIERDDEGVTSSATLEWRYDTYANNDSFIAVINDLAALDSLSFEALEKLRAGN